MGVKAVPTKIFGADGPKIMQSPRAHNYTLGKGQQRCYFGLQLKVKKRNVYKRTLAARGDRDTAAATDTVRPIAATITSAQHHSSSTYNLIL